MIKLFFFSVSVEGFYQSPEKPAGLKLILKVGANSGTPEYGGESPNQAAMLSQHYQQQMGFNYSINAGEQEYDRYLGHKKLKKKKKKKDKRHKHHHKDKKRKREESSQDIVVDGDNIIMEISKKIAPSQPAMTRPNVSAGGEARTAHHIIASGLSPHREPRTCVLKKIAERTPLQRLLEHLLR